MANWSAGLKTLGEGLGRMGVVKKQEEENHLEAMRREAIEKLRREHDVSMTDKRIEAEKGLFEAREKAETGRAATREAAESERQRTSEAGADRRSNAQIAAQDRRSVDAAIANVNANSSRQLIAIANARQKIQLARAEAGDMADPGSIAQWDAAMADLEEQALVVNESRVFEIRRIREGNWGKPLSEQEANALAVGAKGENSEDVVAAPAAAAPAPAAPAPAAPQAPAAEPASVVTGAQQTENDLFPTGIRLGPLSPDEFRHPPGIEKAKDWLQTQRSGSSPSDRRRGGSR